MKTVLDILSKAGGWHHLRAIFSKLLSAWRSNAFALSCFVAACSPRATRSAADRLVAGAVSASVRIASESVRVAGARTRSRQPVGSGSARRATSSSQVRLDS